MRPNRCPLCRARAKEVLPIGSVPLCARCTSGGATEAARDRGWEVTEASQARVVSYKVQTGRPTGLTVQLVPEGLRHKAIKLLVNEIQVGEKAFDDAVYVSTTTRGATQAWLARPEVRETLLAVLRQDRSISIDGGLLVVQDADRPALDRTLLAAEALAVAVQLPSDG